MTPKSDTAVPVWLVILLGLVLMGGAGLAGYFLLNRPEPKAAVEVTPEAREALFNDIQQEEIQTQPGHNTQDPLSAPLVLPRPKP